MIEPMPNVRLGILRALRSKLNSEIQTYDMNLEILLGHSVGIGEHSDITKEAIAVINTKLGE